MRGEEEYSSYTKERKNVTNVTFNSISLIYSVQIITEFKN